MNAKELYDWIGDNTYPEQEVRLEVGGEEAALKVITSIIDDGVVILSTKEPT